MSPCKSRSRAATHRGSLYHRDDMWRIEHNDPGSIEVPIVRKDKGLMWLLLGRTQQFATISFDRSMGKTLERSMAHEIGRETIGSEDSDSHPTTVFQVIAREGQEDVIYYQWWAEDLPLPLRLARKDGASRSIIGPSNPLSHRDNSVNSGHIRAICCITPRG